MVRASAAEMEAAFWGLAICLSRFAANTWVLSARRISSYPLRRATMR